MSHPYGPHDERTAPKTGVVRCGARASFCARPGCRDEHEDDLHFLVARQRAQVNSRAHEEARKRR